MSNKKIAILFSGQARASEFTHKNLNEFLIKQFPGADTFFYICEDRDSNNVLQYFSPSYIKIEPDKKIDEDGIRHRQPNLQQFLQMLYSRKKVLEMMNEFENKGNFKYDIVIHSRLDQEMMIPLKENFVHRLEVDKYLYVSDVHNFQYVFPKQGGVNDRFFICDSEMAHKYLSLYDKIGDYKKELIFHAESLLSHHLKLNNVIVKRVPFLRTNRVRKNGERIDNRVINKELWMPGDY